MENNILTQDRGINRRMEKIIQHNEKFLQILRSSNQGGEDRGACNMMGRLEKTSKILDGNSQGKRSLGSAKQGCQDHIKVEHKQSGRVQTGFLKHAAVLLLENS
jgi:hypothetical protein